MIYGDLSVKNKIPCYNGYLLLEKLLQCLLILNIVTVKNKLLKLLNI